MAYPDDWTSWNDYGGTFAVNTNSFYEGNASVECITDTSSGTSGARYDPSKGGGYSSFRMVTRAKNNGTGSLTAGMLFCVGSGDFPPGIILAFSVSGGVIEMADCPDRIENDAGAATTTSTISSTSPSATSWERYRLTGWIDSGNAYGRVEWYDGSAWTQLGTDVSLSSVANTKGGIGVGGFHGQGYPNGCLMDNTELYY